MRLIPALDLMGGNAVRLLQGKADAIKRYDGLGSPVDIARKWVDEGAELLHIIDLDSAFSRGNNIEHIWKILDSLETPIQLGGGIRTLEKAEYLLDKGIYRVIVGSMAVRNPESVYRLLRKYGEERVSIALDHRRGLLAIDGWRENTGISLKDAMMTHLENGVNIFLVTYVENDGTLNGPDIDSINNLGGFDARIISAGGISSIDDLHSLKKTGIYAAVIGKALYEQCFTLRDAINELGVF